MCGGLYTSTDVLFGSDVTETGMLVQVFVRGFFSLCHDSDGDLMSLSGMHEDENDGEETRRNEALIDNRRVRVR